MEQAPNLKRRCEEEREMEGDKGKEGMRKTHTHTNIIKQNLFHSDKRIKIRNIPVWEGWGWERE